MPISGDSAPRRYDVVAETRRRGSRAEKRAIVAEAMRPGVSVSEVARRHGLHSSLLFRWRREFVAAGGQVELAKLAAPSFVPIALPAPAGGGPAESGGPVPRSAERGHPPPAPDDSAIEIDLRNGRRLRVPATVDTAALQKAPLAIEAVRRIDELFAIEREINGLAPDRRLAVRRERSKPLLDDLEKWLRDERRKL